ncbi:MAG: hypothetical protein IPO00_01545 [Betaproteobacteria bacterium]|nr:hypothetical protein [Betaproteobacteria bacterium]
MFGALFGASSKEADAAVTRIGVLLDLLEPLINKDFLKEVKPALDKHLQPYGELWNDPAGDCVQIGIMTDQPSYILNAAREGSTPRPLPPIVVNSFMIVGYGKLATLLVAGSRHSDSARWSVSAKDGMMTKATKHSKLVAKKLTEMPGWTVTSVAGFTSIARDEVSES